MISWAVVRHLNGQEMFVDADKLLAVAPSDDGEQADAWFIGLGKVPLRMSVERACGQLYLDDGDEVAGAIG